MSDFEDLDDVFGALRSPATPSELSGETGMVDLMASHHRATKGSTMFTSRRSRVAVLIAAGVIGFGGVAAAGPGGFDLLDSQPEVADSTTTSTTSTTTRPPRPRRPPRSPRPRAPRSSSRDRDRDRDRDGRCGRRRRVRRRRRPGPEHGVQRGLLPRGQPRQDRQRRRPWRGTVRRHRSKRCGAVVVRQGRRRERGGRRRLGRRIDRRRRR